ncbi:MAG: response regulator [Myxococcales bacterium]|nr:response regulator [Myxococcales bacterium]
MRVLVVDDEPILATLLARFARLGGFEATVAHDGLEAWKLFEGEPDAWDLIITDIRMPGLDGVTLAQRVRASRGDLPVVLISGHGQLPDVDALSPAVFLAKPFRRAQLLAAMEASTAVV